MFQLGINSMLRLLHKVYNKCFSKKAIFSVKAQWESEDVSEEGIQYIFKQIKSSGFYAIICI